MVSLDFTKCPAVDLGERCKDAKYEPSTCQGKSVLNRDQSYYRLHYNNLAIIKIPLKDVTTFRGWP